MKCLLILFCAGWFIRFLMDTEAFCCYSSHQNINKPAIDIVMFESKAADTAIHVT